MRCPRCSATEIPDSALECPLCGYRADRTQVTVLPADAVDERVRAELGLEFHIENELWRAHDFRCYLAREAAGQPVNLIVAVPPSPPDAAMVARFRRAITNAGKVDHPHVPPLFGSGVGTTLFWFTTKHQEGRPLHELLRQLGPLDLATCRRLVEQVASALDHAHRRGVTHGDVTTTNILVDADRWAFLTNFCVMQAIRGVSAARHGGPSGDQRDLGLVISRCLNLPADSAAVPATVMQVIQRATSSEPADRFPTLLDFVAAFTTGAPQAPEPVMSTGHWQMPVEQRRHGWCSSLIHRNPGPRRRKWPIVVLGVLAVAAGIGACSHCGPKGGCNRWRSRRIQTSTRTSELSPVGLVQQPPPLPVESLRVKPQPTIARPVPAAASEVKQPPTPVQSLPTKSAAPARPAPVTVAEAKLPSAPVTMPANPCT